MSKFLHLYGPLGRIKEFQTHNARIPAPIQAIIFYILYRELYQKPTCFRKNFGILVQILNVFTSS